MIDIDLPERLLRGLWSCVLETETDGEFSARPEHLAAAGALMDLLVRPPMTPRAVADLRLGPTPGVAGHWRLSLSPVAHDTAVESVRHIVELIRDRAFGNWEVPIRLLVTVDEFHSLCSAMGVDPQG
ncbi:MAG: hypothetical protein LBS56_04420 [Propionibacteriaceae bacterium]|jgi:hypothetical protein|nr:hypothetical protein [Propionibacteriaceae bacterium]